MSEEHPNVDAVQLMREIRDRLSEQFAGKSFAEIKRIIAERQPLPLRRQADQEPRERTA